MFLFSIFLILISLCIIFRHLSRRLIKPNNSFEASHGNTVYCLMVTSNDSHRRPFCKASVRNFDQQLYREKRLIIINLSNTSILTDSRDDILEVFVKRNGLSLGELRNMSLEMVPPNAWWTLWDDDDWRSTDYLSRLMDWSKGYDFLMIQNRIEYNTKTNFAYALTLRSGLMSFFSKKHPLLRYEHVNTKEDVIVKETALRSLKTRIVDNPSEMYIRMVHGKNTSPYVNAKKQSVRDTQRNKVYFERDLKKQEGEYLRKILSTNYKHVHHNKLPRIRE